MALQSQQIISLACQIAKCPGMTVQAGLLLNVILDNLCQTQDIELARGVYTFNFNGGVGNGSGPYTLPADYLRARMDEVFYTINGVVYVLISIDLAEFDALVQTAGFQSFPQNFATDMSTSPPNMYIWPPANGGYPATVRYQKQMPSIANAESSAVAPWFPNSMYLQQELTGRLCQLTGDDRAEAFLSNNEEAHPMGSNVILRQFLKLQNDPEGRAKTVSLDRRRFGPGQRGLPNTKLVGW